MDLGRPYNFTTSSKYNLAILDASDFLLGAGEDLLKTTRMDSCFLMVRGRPNTKSMLISCHGLLGMSRDCKGQHFAYNVWPVDIGDIDQLPWQMMVGYFDGTIGRFLCFFVLFVRFFFWLFFFGLEGWVFGSVVVVGVTFWRGGGSQVQSHARGRVVGHMGFGGFVVGFGVCLWAAAAWLGLFKMSWGKYLKCESWFYQVCEWSFFCVLLWLSCEGVLFWVWMGLAVLGLE